MGWYFSRQTMDQTIQELLQPNAYSKVIAHSRRGNQLWSVREMLKDSEALKAGQKVIVLDLLSQKDGETGYKPMDEGMHPYYYNCPLKFLKLADANTCEDWRKGVRQWHDQEKAKKLKPLETCP